MDLEELVFQIEDPLLDEELRDDLISKLNIYGYAEERVEEAAEAYWSSA